jgi:23S rRNA (uracil1939-C5)-methyltransferase
LTVAGDPHVIDLLDVRGHAVRLRRHVLSFFQGNRYLLPALVAQVVDHVGAGDRVVDLYAGTGLFSVSAAVAGDARVTAVEGNRTAAADLSANAAAAADRVTVAHEPVEEFLGRRHERPDLVIVDPPRTGMTREALQGAIDLDGPAIVYVSCDVATFARDTRKLLDAGYSLERIAAFDLFPNTPHVETVATFRRPQAG